MSLVSEDGEADGNGKVSPVVVVGVKFDAESRELLTWALVKVAQPGDRVVALHVLNRVIDSTGSLISLVKAFDSMLAVYEGFCNLKQVDLKLKVCRGSSVKKILVREAKSYGAAKLVVGISKTRHRIRSSASVAKFCAKKLSKSFWVFAVNNGKILFQRDGNYTTTDILQDANQQKDRSVHRSLSKNGKVLIDGNVTGVENKSCKQCQGFLHKSGSSFKKRTQKNCTSGDSKTPLAESSVDGNVENSLALVPYQNNEVAMSSNSLVVLELPQSKHGWSVARRVICPEHQRLEKSSQNKTSLIQWVLRLPSRYTSAIVYPDRKQTQSVKSNEDLNSMFDGESGAIVPFDNEATRPLSPYQGFPKELENLHDRFSSTCRLLSYKELSLATSDFHPDNMVGKGGHSHVYRGSLVDGKELAVKILKPSVDVLKEFVSEIEIITSLHHKNITSLFGFCFEDNKLLLVYDFLSRGSLEESLHGNKKDAKSFGWNERYKVALGVAEALDYLHNSCDQPVIHRDVKSSNILLLDDFEPQLSDFGLASRASTSSSHLICTDIAGTFGYLAPEYVMHGKVSDKIDVYAFGVVLLELLSGRKPINRENPRGEESLVMWAKPILKDGKFPQLLDPSLAHDIDDVQLERMVLAATLCIIRAPSRRPQINLVLRLLQGDEEAKMWGRQQLGAAEELDVSDEAFPHDIQSHLNLALLDVDDNTLSIGSSERTVSIEDYLKGRWSQTSSFTSHVFG
ncbi:probable receptor-like serine/threonine-protein kinase At5g57670 [Mangifera indica]|uniref:probable receptor-like serine/threonine-protein kinase At5g57670 n=1 Tax=Mangifera indica TaxID=29780 RepID=UPI001CF9FFAA|nr:probable receptor-like serine/threonine-protein kinase At5g57670 [Mangifera indica]